MIIIKKGFSLIELIIFIIIISILLTGTIFIFSQVLTAAHQPNSLTVAIEAAEQRMDLILGQKHIQGFNHSQDPCVLSPLLYACNFYTKPPHNCVINVTTTPLGLPVNGSLITVKVTRCGKASLSSYVGKY